MSSKEWAAVRRLERVLVAVMERTSFLAEEYSQELNQDARSLAECQSLVLELESQFRLVVDPDDFWPDQVVSSITNSLVAVDLFATSSVRALAIGPKRILCLTGEYQVSPTECLSRFLSVQDQALKFHYQLNQLQASLREYLNESGKKDS